MEYFVYSRQPDDICCLTGRWDLEPLLPVGGESLAFEGESWVTNMKVLRHGLRQRGRVPGMRQQSGDLLQAGMVAVRLAREEWLERGNQQHQGFMFVCLFCF